MIGLDTNILVRYIVEDDPVQTLLANELIENKCTSKNTAFINLIVLCELVWVLARAYKCNRKQIKDVLQNLLITENFTVEHHDIAWQALYDFEEGKADYSDCLISRLNNYYECSTSYSFDKNAAKFTNIELLTKGNT